MGLIDLTSTPDVAALDFNTAKEMSETLTAAYPGHAWAVTCEGDKGIATVRNLALSGNWGFVLKLSDMSSSSDWKKKIVMAGGELLERFRLRRGIVDHAAIAALEMDPLGKKTLGDYSHGH